MYTIPFPALMASVIDSKESFPVDALRTYLQERKIQLGDTFREKEKNLSTVVRALDVVLFAKWRDAEASIQNKVSGIITDSVCVHEVLIDTFGGSCQDASYAFAYMSRLLSDSLRRSMLSKVMFTPELVQQLKNIASQPIHILYADEVCETIGSMLQVEQLVTH